MTDIPGNRIRVMAGMEHALTISDEFAPLNAVVILKIEGPIDAERLRLVLAALQRKHPLLRARIASQGKGFAFVFDSVLPIPLIVVERKAPEDWIAVAEDELNRRVDFASGPLLRCHYLHNSSAPGGPAEIVLTFNHAIIDANCGLNLLDELLSGCAGKHTDLGSEVSVEGVYPATSIFPRKFTGVGFARAVTAWMMRQVADEVVYRWRARAARKPPIHAAGRGRVLTMQLSAPLTEALIRTTRGKRITLNAILTAGFMLAVKRFLYPLHDTPFRNITFVDLRPYLSTEIPKSALGSFISMCRLTFQLQDRCDFWKLAQEVNDAIYRSNRRGERFLANALSIGMMKMILKTKMMRMGTTAISYAGAVSLGEDNGPIRLLGLHAFSSNMVVGPEYTALVRLFRRELWWDILYMDSDMGPEMAQQIADELRSILEQAVNGLK